MNFFNNIIYINLICFLLSSIVFLTPLVNQFLPSCTKIKIRKREVKILAKLCKCVEITNFMTI